MTVGLSTLLMGVQLRTRATHDGRFTLFGTLVPSRRLGFILKSRASYASESHFHTAPLVSSNGRTLAQRASTLCFPSLITHISMVALHSEVL